MAKNASAFDQKADNSSLICATFIAELLTASDSPRFCDFKSVVSGKSSSRHFRHVTSQLKRL